MARKRQNSQDIRDLFDNITASDEEELANDNFDSDFSDCDDEEQVELDNNEFHKESDEEQEVEKYRSY